MSGELLNQRPLRRVIRPRVQSTTARLAQSSGSIIELGAAFEKPCHSRRMLTFGTHLRPLSRSMTTTSPRQSAGLPQSLHAAAAALRLLIIDVDGVLTDGALYYDTTGEALKRFHVHDGQGLKLLQQHGIAIAAISGRNSAMVERRLRELGVDEILQGNEQKLTVAEAMMRRRGLAWSACAAIGDDLPDLPLLRRAALSVAPANANAEIKRHVHWTTQASGGNGAVRELADALLEARGQRAAAIAPYLQ